MPFLSRSSSSYRSIPSEGSNLSRENGIINDKYYAALDFNGYTEKPLSKQLGPIAVDEMGCRLPGNVSSPAQFWDIMMNKRTAPYSTAPSSRFKIDAHLHPNNNRPGLFNVPGGYFLLGSLHEFDPGLFNISPVEDTWMDPQQRKLLEVVYETFESAGVGLVEMENSKTGGFVGSFTSDFQQISFKEPDIRHSYAATGVDPGIISARISHVFNLHGPSLTLNTACSSSVYALHQACNALRNKEFNWDDWNVKVPCEPQHFPAHLPVRRVSVNSFRYGGTNGHFIVEGVESLVPGYSHGQKKQKLIKGSDRGVFYRKRPSLLLFSAHDKPTLLRNIDAHAKVVGDYNLLHLSYTLANRRSLPSRGFVVSSPNPVHTRSTAILYCNKPTKVPCKLVKACNALGSSRLARLADASIATSEHVVVTCDLDGPLLLELEPSELAGLQNIVSNPSSVTWVTAGGLMKGATPEQAMASDVARSVTTTTDCGINEIVRALDRQIYHAKGKESEYCLADGLVYISRLVPDATLNQEDVLVMEGADSLTTFSHEIYGAVVQKVVNVEDINVGDRVFGFSADRLATFQTVSASMVQRAEQGNVPEELVTLPLAYAAAIHGLTTLARVEAGEFVLILHGTGYAGAAAITISKKNKEKKKGSERERESKSPCTVRDPTPGQRR